MQHKVLYDHLFPGDGNEAVAILLCGRSQFQGRHMLLVREVIPVPYEVCIERRPDYVHWPTDFINPLLEKAVKWHMALVKIHCHPGGYNSFSELDDESDSLLFTSIHAWLDDGLPHASCVMLPDGEIFGRFFHHDMALEEIHEISVLGSNFLKWKYGKEPVFIDTSAQERNLQTFGRGTTKLLNELKVGVIGCSGTGSPTVEMLARHGVGTLVIVDPDYVDTLNLNRIIGSTKEDAIAKRLKVDVMERTVQMMGFGTKVIKYASNIVSKKVIKELSGCNFLFGCVDSAEGRHVMNLISSYYLIPLIDMGVKLDADGFGGIERINGSVHYIQPGGSSLLSKEVYDLEKVRAEGIKRLDEEEFHRNGYLAAVGESSPAVISINMQVAAAAVIEFLARIHAFRNEPNESIDTVRLNISDGLVCGESDPAPCPFFSKFVGKGDIEPLLGLVELSENVEKAF